MNESKKKKGIPHPEFILRLKPALINLNSILSQTFPDDRIPGIIGVIRTKKTQSHFLHKNIIPYPPLSIKKSIAEDEEKMLK